MPVRSLCRKRRAKKKVTMVPLSFIVSFGLGVLAEVARSAPCYLWLEADRFEGVKGSNYSFVNYKSVAEAPGWGLNGPGVSAEWGQGGESEWTSIAAHKDEANAAVTQQVAIPVAGTYAVWVRYADHQFKTEMLRIKVAQEEKTLFDHEFGAKPMVDEHDEFKMYWSSVFVWDKAEAELSKGTATITLYVDRPAQARRHVDVVVLTNDLQWQPDGRAKPPFAYFAVLEKWRGERPDVAPLSATATQADSLRYGVPSQWQRKPLCGQDFWMPWNMGFDWWKDAQGMAVPFSVETQIQKDFVAEFKGKAEVPIFSAPFVVPTFYINSAQQFLADDSPFLKWVKETRKPFCILTNYGQFTFKSDVEAVQCYSNLKALGDQFLGYISGESIAHGAVVDGVALSAKVKAAKTRADVLKAYFEAYDDGLIKKHDAAFKTNAGPLWEKLIPCLSTGSDTWAHALRHWGCTLVGMETAAVMPCWSRRIAFSRGAARQYGGDFLYYHAPNFGDTATTFTHTQNFAGPNAWFHSRYGLVWGPSISWYRKALFQYYMSGASAIYLEQGFDQFFKPGPTEHPVQLNPLGKVTDEFTRFAQRHPDRGVPYTPVAFLLDAAHGWDDVQNSPAAFDRHADGNPVLNAETDGDRMIRELFNVAYYPHPVTEGEPCTAERQCFVGDVFGDIFDVLVTSPTKRDAIHAYPVLVVSGDVSFDTDWAEELQAYVQRGGTLVLNVAQVTGSLPQDLLPLRVRAGVEHIAGESDSFRWGEEAVDCAPFYHVKCRLEKGAKALATAPDGAALASEKSVGKGKVIMTVVPHLLDGTRRAHPLAAKLMIHLTQGLLPVKVVGDAQFMLNRNDTSWVLTLFNNRGIYKPQQGLAAPRREEVAQVTISTPQPVAEAREWTEETALSTTKEADRTTLKLRVPAGGIRIVELRTGG